MSQKKTTNRSRSKQRVHSNMQARPLTIEMLERREVFAAEFFAAEMWHAHDTQVAMADSSRGSVQFGRSIVVHSETRQFETRQFESRNVGRFDGSARSGDRPWMGTPRFNSMVGEGEAAAPTRGVVTVQVPLLVIAIPTSRPSEPVRFDSSPAVRPVPINGGDAVTESAVTERTIPTRVSTVEPSAASATAQANKDVTSPDNFSGHAAVANSVNSTTAVEVNAGQDVGLEPESPSNNLQSSTQGMVELNDREFSRSEFSMRPFIGNDDLTDSWSTLPELRSAEESESRLSDLANRSNSNGSSAYDEAFASMVDSERYQSGVPVPAGMMMLMHHSESELGASASAVDGSVAVPPVMTAGMNPFAVMQIFLRGFEESSSSENALLANISSSESSGEAIDQSWLSLSSATWAASIGGLLLLFETIRKSRFVPQPAAEESQKASFFKRLKRKTR